MQKLSRMEARRPTLGPQGNSVDALAVIDDPLDAAGKLLRHVTLIGMARFSRRSPRMNLANRSPT